MEKKLQYMALVSTYRPPLTTRQLLVSVQNAAEALTAFQAGVPWVDLKNPAAGSLGRPSKNVCFDFAAVASQYPHSRISVALGEMDQVDWVWAAEWLPTFAVGKVGLRGIQSVDQALVDQLLPFKSQIVPALYADWQRAGSAPPACVLQLAKAIGSPYLLIDTCIKDGRGLFEWLNVDELKELQFQTRTFGADLVVAGSLRSSDWGLLDQLGPVTVGVRGAVCETSANRSSNLCPAAIAEWLRWSRQ